MKKYVFGLVAVVLAISLSAFTFHSTPKASLAGEKWFVFNGTDPADLNDPSMYSLDGNGSTPTVCPTDVTSAYRCEVFAVPTGSPARPNLSTIVSQRKRTTP